MKISDFDTDGLMLMLGEYVAEATDSLVQKKGYKDFVLKVTGETSSYKFHENGVTIFLCTDNIRKSAVSSVQTNFISVYSDSVYIQGAWYTRMSTSEFEQDLFSLSTLYSIELLQKLYISTFCTSILYGDYAVHINDLLIEHYLKGYV